MVAAAADLRGHAVLLRLGLGLTADAQGAVLAESSSVPAAAAKPRTVEALVNTAQVSPSEQLQTAPESAGRVSTVS